MIEHIKPFNFILTADGYKCLHWREIPPEVEFTYITVVPRKVSKYSDKIVAMGQTMLASLFASVRITESMIDEAEIEITEQGYEFNRKGWEYIARNLDGKLPLKMFGVEEGRIIEPQTPMVSIVNTLPNFAWLSAYVETISQSILWKMTTVASICKAVRITLEEFCTLTGTPISDIDYMLHNFGDRGADGPEAAVIAGIAHAALFNGTDCIQANGYIKRLYGTNKAYMSSIEATEHSVMCAHSHAETRDDFGAAIMAVDRLYACVERAAKGNGLPIMSVVIDTYDSRRFVQKFTGIMLKEKIVESGGCLVHRPDTGDATIEPGLVGKDLEATFGVTINEAGYKDLHPAVGVIQGDGVRIDTHRAIIQGWVNAGFSLKRFCLGMGSGVTHDGGRDDFSFSIKATANCIHGKWYRLLKEPITDFGKKSLSGLVRCRENRLGNLEVYDSLETGELYKMWHEAPGWRNWYEDGFRGYRQSFDDVRQRARK